MQHKTTLLFDFDGTLADTLWRILLISNRFSDTFGYKKIEMHEVDAYRKKKTRQAIRDLEIPVLMLPRIATRIKQELQKEMHLVQPVEMLKESLAALRNRFRLGIVTSNSSSNVALFLQHNDMQYFDIIHSDSSIFGKSRILNKVLNKYSLKAAEVAYIGDETRDIEAAQKSGIDMIAVSWGMHTADTLALHKPTYLIHHPREMLRLFSADEGQQPRNITPTPC